jgi:AAA domain
MERQIIARARDGIGQATTRVPVERAVALIDKAATHTLGHALNPEQRQAATAILASTDRSVTIQGSAGTGKSTVFAAVNAVDSKSRDALLILTPQNKLSAELNANSGIEARSLAGFLARYERLAASPAQPSLADQQTFDRTTIILDEASMVSTRQMLGLVQITEKLGVNRLVLVGDVGQIAADDVGSPFDQLQEAAFDPIRLSENLSQRDGIMKLAVAKLQAGLVREAFDTLGNRVIESADPAAAAAKAWLALDANARAESGLFTSGHHLREQLLDKVRAALVAEGKLGAEEIKLPTLERLNMTREQMRSVNSGLSPDVPPPMSRAVGLIDALVRA